MKKVVIVFGIISGVISSAMMFLTFPSSDKLREKGATDAAIAAKQEEMEKLKAMLNNPLINAAVTFIEPFPVGVLGDAGLGGDSAERDAGGDSGWAQAI